VLYAIWIMKHSCSCCTWVQNVTLGLTFKWTKASSMNSLRCAADMFLYLDGE